MKGGWDEEILKNGTMPIIVPFGNDDGRRHAWELKQAIVLPHLNPTLIEYRHNELSAIIRDIGHRYRFPDDDMTVSIKFMSIVMDI